MSDPPMIPASGSGTDEGPRDTLGLPAGTSPALLSQRLPRMMSSSLRFGTWCTPSLSRQYLESPSGFRGSMTTSSLGLPGDQHRENLKSRKYREGLPESIPVY
jgi:hypothetical protein